MFLTGSGGFILGEEGRKVKRLFVLVGLLGTIVMIGAKFVKFDGSLLLSPFFGLKFYRRIFYKTLAILVGIYHHPKYAR